MKVKEKYRCQGHHISSRLALLNSARCWLYCALMNVLCAWHQNPCCTLSGVYLMILFLFSFFFYCSVFIRKSIFPNKGIKNDRKDEVSSRKKLRICTVSLWMFLCPITDVHLDIKLLILYNTQKMLNYLEAPLNYVTWTDNDIHKLSFHYRSLYSSPHRHIHIASWKIDHSYVL